MLRRDDGSGGGGRGMGGRGGPNRYDNRGSNRNGDYGGNGGWDDRRQQQHPQEVTFSVPSSKCGVIIGRGGETIKTINQQSGAHCELDRRNPNNQSGNEKTFIIRGDPDQIEAAKRIISEKVQMPLNFMNVGVGNNLPTVSYSHRCKVPCKPLVLVRPTPGWRHKASTRKTGTCSRTSNNGAPRPNSHRTKSNNSSSNSRLPSK